ncbi:hypothetical protein [Lysobacter enzymogenes]|uniref:hypothetical protein n=1 Tax=Lysobacter enzymogenes TaxID=69 RepID=UPI00089AC3AD|nr:hypothetical protein [Lysobacter enzymogenes]SDX70582.1 hypothetical protein SAMN05421681_10770 [Lysobacter enzymogenes]
MSDFFVELDRTFHLSVANGAKSDDIDLTQPFGQRGQMSWSDLLARPRVVILSGGGSGKTVEIRHRAKLLHAEGQSAFFLRIEHVCNDFAGAFDKAAGNHEQFLEWVKSGDEGWVFLDSVDEARLKSPKEFEQAISYIGRMLEPVLQRAHILVTGREAAWRARTDRELIRTHLPYESSTPVVTSDPAEEPPAPKDNDSELEGASIDWQVDDLDAEDDDGPEEPTNKKKDEPPEAEPNAVLLVGFDTLNEKQVETFARAKKVADVASFLEAVTRKEAQSETARPLDLEGLVDYWNANGRIGSQFELTEVSIVRRLSEVDPDRAEATTLSREQLRQAARTLAAANMLMQTPEIRLLDAPAELHGVEPGDLLNWSEKDIRTLLLRPLFVASQFGAVRIYVQKAREFLTAEWLHRRLVDHASRSRIEALFFQVQYGREVVVPAMRGVLPWLALLDPDVLARVRRVAPEVMFEGGDPSRLPLEMRRELLSKACGQLAGASGHGSLTDFQAVQRFAAPDLADHTKALLAIHHNDDEVVYFLMRMVWQGEIAGALDEAKQVASRASDFNVRLIALRAVAALGTDADRKTVRVALLDDATPPERGWVAEVVKSLPRDADGVAWLLQACIGAKREERYSIDPLADAVETYVAELPLALLPLLVTGLERLLELAADHDNDDGGHRRRPNDWLMSTAIIVLDRLVQAKDTATLQAPAMALLRRIPVAVRFGDNEDREDSTRLAEHVSAWETLNRALFWQDVEETRAHRLKKSGEPLVDIWRVGMFGRYWRLTVDDFEYILKEIGTRPLLDDRLVALSAAHSLYRENGRPSTWRQRLRRRANGVPELQAALAALLGPLSDQFKKWRRQEARRKQRSARAAEKREENRAGWRKHLMANLDSLRTPFPGGGVRKNQHYLSTRMREFDKNSSRWADGRWRSLIPEFGHDVARAFRDGAVAFWRTNTPELLSTGAAPNNTPLTTVFGLIGLLFDSRETSNWADQLTHEEAELAARYAMRELNGFPPWLPRLFAAHPEAVLKVVLGEIDYELRTALAINSPSHDVLSDVSGVGSWMWNRLAPELLKRLNAPPASAAHLRQVLTILSGSEVEGAGIAALASTHVGKSADEFAAAWFAAWIGVDPDHALPALATHLEALRDKTRQTGVAMHCLIALTGGRRGRRVAREGYRTVPHLTALFLLMHQYIVESEDIDRAGKGVYSPTLRDDAQEARNQLLAPLRDTPGQEAYFALLRIAAEHPSKHGRAWVTRLAYARAVTDADRPGWGSSQVREFQENLERTPRNHQELHDLAIDRLLDFKHSLEHGETSIAGVLLTPEETEVRNVVADWCRARGLNRYVIAQEEEFADKKRTDIRFLSMAFDNPVPAELKLANQWSGPELAERLENQLCNDYLRDQRSSRGIFLLMHQGGRKYWGLPDGSRVTSVEELTAGLQAHWAKVAKDFPHVHAVHVIGIDLTMRAEPKGRGAAKSTTKKIANTATRKPTSDVAKKVAKKAAKNVTKKAAKKVTKSVTKKAPGKTRPKSVAKSAAKKVDVSRAKSRK